VKKLLTLSDIGTKGLNSDVAPWDLPPEFITAGKNFRVDAGSILSSGGSEVWSTSGTAFNPGYLMHIPAVSSNYWLVYGRSAVYVFDGTTWTDVSSTAGYAGIGIDDEQLWTGCMLGQIPIASNPQGAPEYWSPQSPGQILQPLQFDAANTWAAKGYSFKVLRSHKNFLFALNLSEGASELPNSYRWSHPADINGLPFSWDETDLSSLAGKAQIGGNAGAIIDGHSLRDAFAIYSENATSVLDFTGDEFVWRRRELSTSFGLISRNCIAEVKGTHFFLGDGDIVMNDGNKIESIIHNKLRKQLISRMSVDAFTTSYVVNNLAKKELWFCVPEEDSLTPNVAYIYNWRDDSWAVRDLPTAVNFATYGSQTDPTTTWDTWGETWDSASGTWGSRKSTPLDDTIVGVSSANSSLILMDPPSSASDLNAVIERTNFPLEGHKPVTTITRVYPHVEGSGDMIIQFGSQDYAGAPVRWKPEVTFNPGTQRKVDVRTTGELHCWRIRSVGSNAWSMSGIDIEYTTAGER
tara:strand:- start:17322 stop:18887 length:1566 start_codon:yes stop_codon:yes gene_type:complete